MPANQSTFKLLGTGSSLGIPVVGCPCETCHSLDTRDRRLRCSAWIHNQDTSLIIDVGPDFRYQALTNGVDRVDAVLITHEHNDHIIGLDDLRPMIFTRKEPITLYGEERVLSEIQERFKYAFLSEKYPGTPSFEMKVIQPGDIISIGDFSIKAVRLIHGKLPILGYIINEQIAYFTDTNQIPDETMQEINEIPTLILDTLNQHPHHSHFSQKEAVDHAARCKAKETYLIHLGHRNGPTRKWEQLLPEDVYSSYDGQSFDLQ